MRRSAHACAVLLALGALPSCSHSTANASAATPAATSEERPADRRRASRDILTIEDIQARQWENAYELVSTLRRHWLNPRGADTINGPRESVRVLLDGVPLGGIEELRGQSVMGVQYIQYFDPITAAGRWGMGYGKGAIYISMRQP